MCSYAQVSCCGQKAVSFSPSTVFGSYCPFLSSSIMVSFGSLWEEMGYDVDVPFRAEHSAVTFWTLCSCESPCYLPSTAKRSIYDEVLEMIQEYNEESLGVRLIPFPICSVTRVDSPVGPMICLVTVLALVMVTGMGSILWSGPSVESESSWLLSWCSCHYCKNDVRCCYWCGGRETFTHCWWGYK